MAYTVLRDTREQQGWTFASNQYCVGTVETTLQTGDYTLQGFENLLTVERKGTAGEFAHNIVEKRFEEELKRMEAFAHAFIILEFTMDEIISFPKGSGIPIKLWPKLRMSPYFLLKRITEFELCYKAKLIFAGKHGKDVASSIFKRVVETHGKEPEPRT